MDINTVIIIIEKMQQNLTYSPTCIKQAPKG